jgi:uncharacterized protein YjeT (DUF2065 family)
MANRLLPPVLSRRRIWLAYGVALVADGLQILLTPLGPAAWLFLDDIIDVIAMILLTVIAGFHPLFLPTFVTKLIPVVDILPTWTGCTAIVIALRRKQQTPTVTVSPPPPPRISQDVIDV